MIYYDVVLRDREYADNQNLENRHPSFDLDMPGLSGLSEDSTEIDRNFGLEFNLV